MTMFSMIMGTALVTMATGLVKNPIKLSVMLVMYSAMLMLMISMKTGAKWFPILFFLLFMGGILMMFMVLSSVMPNEKSGKMKIAYFMLFNFFMLETILHNNIPFMAQTSESIKTLLATSAMMPLMTLIMILYFFLAIEMLKSVKLPMRTVSCQKKKLIL